MERKNTILLTVIAVATLLVAVVGATFAYFTATTNPGDGSTQTSNVTTPTKLDSVKLTKTTITGTSGDDLAIYPGRMIYVGASVGAAVEGDGTGKSYQVSYSLTGAVTLNNAFTKGDITYYLYRTTKSVTSPVTCGQVQETDTATGVQYSVNCEKDSTDFTGSSEGEGTLVKTGTISASEEGPATINLENETVDTGKTNYYYLIAQYESKNEDQSADKSNTITVSLEDISLKSTKELKG